MTSYSHLQFTYTGQNCEYKHELLWKKLREDVDNLKDGQAEQGEQLGDLTKGLIAVGVIVGVVAIVAVAALIISISNRRRYVYRQ